jgi:hypothetical protein
MSYSLSTSYNVFAGGLSTNNINIIADKVYTYFLNYDLSECYEGFLPEGITVSNYIKNFKNYMK